MRIAHVNVVREFDGKELDFNCTVCKLPNERYQLELILSLQRNGILFTS